MPRTKIYDGRSTCTFRTTKKDQENLAKAIEYFEAKFGKNISKNVAINLSLEFIAGLQDTATRKSHHSKAPTTTQQQPNSDPQTTRDSKEQLDHPNNATGLTTGTTRANSPPDLLR